MSLRLRDIPAVPFLVLLHLFFTVSSLFLRTYELLTTTDSDATENEERLTISAAASASSSPSLLASQPVRRDASPPRHVGVVISAPAPFRAGGGERGHGRTMGIGGKRWTGEQRMRMIECVLNLVELAAEERVNEVSVYDRSGLLQSVKPELVADLQYLPPSPPMSDNRDMVSGDATPPQQLHEVGSLQKQPGSAEARQDEEEVTSLTVFPSSGFHVTLPPSTSQPRTRPLTVHILPPSAADVIAVVINDLIAAGVEADEITQNMLDKRIKERLHFARDPDLLIVHPLYEPRGWESWLPRPAPELGGYPFWTLRITEIYHHSPPLPLLSVLKPLLHLARSSTLPFLRKLGRLVPPPPHIRNEMLDLYDGTGRLGREEWEGAMRAWAAVEQRLGR